MHIQLNRKLALILLLASTPTYTYASSWFGSTSAPSAYPSSFSSWTSSQYESFQNSVASVRESTFDAWDDSRLRQWLLEQGVVAPKGPREEIVLQAKQRWRDWEKAKANYESSASSVISEASSTVSSATSAATSAVTSFVAQATADLPQHPLDDTKDYIWSTWDDAKLRKYLVQQGLIDDRTAAGKKRDELIAIVKDRYKDAQQNAYEMWSDTYMHDWLASHNLIDTRSSLQKSRDEYLDLMRDYYYTSSQRVWDSWSESDMKQWLVDNGIVKSEAEIRKEKMRRMVQDNYSNAKSTAVSAWSESQMRNWLIENGYMKSDAQAKRDEVVKMFKDKYDTVSASAASYFVWPDARLRAYLREHSILSSPTSSSSSFFGSPNQESFSLPKSRSELLQETRIRWVQTTSAAENVVNKIKEILDANVIAPVGEQLERIWDLVVGTVSSGKAGVEDAEADVDEKFEEGKEQAKGEYAKARKHTIRKGKAAHQKVNGEM
ncbi:hypothetical protein BDP27DRAFT_1216537 [Rhodocollybia butyracea]|uniref:Uncharacterized protein n=1 Tax=Rhodocollybia butyracea TaxID=206335 RepID=A0A9P5Q1C2_9AGAR|nr:hypothetical protein BDP27DRAFT_1216537 [Rhodocollybia butyracea]